MAEAGTLNGDRQSSPFGTPVQCWRGRRVIDSHVSVAQHPARNGLQSVKRVDAQGWKGVSGECRQTSICG